MQTKQRKFLIFVLVVFLLAGGVDILVIQTFVVPKLLADSGDELSNLQTVPPFKEAMPKAATSPRRTESRKPADLKIPVEDKAVSAGPSLTDETVPKSSLASRSISEGRSEATIKTAQGGSEKATEKLLPGIETLRFGPNKNLLWKFEKRILRDVAAIAGRYSNVGIVLVGHADKVERNPDELSRARVQAAKAFLMAEGVDPRRIETEAMGDSKPATKDTSESERKKNRRVRVRLVILKDDV